MTQRPARVPQSPEPHEPDTPTRVKAVGTDASEEAESPAWLSLCIGFLTGFVLAALSVVFTQTGEWIQPTDAPLEARSELPPADRMPAAATQTPAQSVLERAR